MSASAFVHRWVPSQRPDARTLLLLHGTGGNEDDLLPLGRLLDPEAALLSPRGPVLEHGMPRFFRRLSEGVFDLADLARRTDDLAAWAGEAAAEYGFAPERLIAIGFSNGANIAASVLLRRPGTFPAAILFRAMVPFEPEQVPDLHGTRVFLAAGRADTLVPGENTERLATLLRSAGADVELAWEDAGHQLTRHAVEAARQWLDRTGAGRP